MEKGGFVRSRKNASIMDKEFKIPFLNAFLIRYS